MYRTPALPIAITAFLVAGCTTAQKMEMTMVASPTEAASALTPSTPKTTFCLRGEWRTTNYLLYAESYAQAWTTEGDCSVTRAHRTVEGIVLNWRYKGGRLESQVCRNTSTCNYSNRDYGITHSFECISATASDRPFSAHITDDRIACP